MQNILATDEPMQAYRNDRAKRSRRRDQRKRRKRRRRVEEGGDPRQRRRRRSGTGQPGRRRWVARVSAHVILIVDTPPPPPPSTTKRTHTHEGAHEPTSSTLYTNEWPPYAQPARSHTPRADQPWTRVCSLAARCKVSSLIECARWRVV